MPAGNDAQAAYSELTDKFGKGHARAEDLIAAARQRYPQGLRKAQMRPLDGNASALIEDDEVAQALDLPKGSKVVSSAVRGGHVVAVVETSDGRTRKEELPRSAFDLGEEEEVEEAPIFASDAAEEYAEAKGLTPETIAQFVSPTGAKQTFTKKDVAKAAEAKAAQ